MTYTAAVSGATGYAGGEVLRLLCGHPDIEITTVAAHSSAGRRLGELQPHLHALADRTVVDTTAENLAGHDVVFLALPHGQSAAVAAALPEGTVVVDAGADHRLTSASAWEKFYGTEHAGTWPYGLPELVTDPRGGKQREALRGATRIAVPGCYPTGSLLALAPALAAGLVAPQDLVVVSASGTSGAGKAAKPHLLGAETMGGMSPYGVGGGHRHTPEIEQGLAAAGGQDVTLSFTPTLAPMPRGILTTATAVLRPGVDDARVREVYDAAYGDEPFVHVLPEGQWPTTKSVQASNHVALQLAVDHHAGRLVVSTVLDNLTKGTAGAAVQSLNLALGLPETTGLTGQGIAP
ncbi:N-acetyl-gamma-glutamyl-phosphate reductase [Kocuria tytonicola]|uniref:N-acetyl-gamma-glutamyl-phosphate reductase n=1 Tax=Kocuria tytonicola TaxID=2055946 RepID=UPI000EF87EEA|nr:N-acetyl-gamma-glutamyl-phosphate reductase [Kocuria tytonicola]RLZ03391.1 N-acetyl-gamma-glutamyl-phosphate reductase [Kocuria tytonicola]